MAPVLRDVTSGDPVRRARLSIAIAPGLLGALKAVAKDDDRPVAEMARILLEGALVRRIRAGPIGRVSLFPSPRDAGHGLGPLKKA